YESGKEHFDLYERAGRVRLYPGGGGLRTEIRKLGDAYLTDDPLGHGTKLTPQGGSLQVDDKSYRRVDVPKPPAAPERWHGLIGEYGWDHNTLYILEKDGKLHCLIEWVFLYPLAEESENVFAFPDFGLYHGEKLIFTRDNKGRAARVVAANVKFDRRKLAGEEGTFKIRPERPVAELRKEALAAKPPGERDRLGKPALVEVASLEPGIKLEIRYASDDNFLGTPVYTSAHAFLQRPAAEALVRVHKKLAARGYGLMIHDAYRPWYV